MLVVPDAVARAMLAELVAAAHPFNGAKVMLYKAPIVLTQTVQLSDLVPANFTGYALSSAITWGTPFEGVDGTPVVVGNLKSFTASDAAVPQTIYGYGVVNGGGTVLLWAENFATPVPMLVGGATVIVLPQFGGVSQASSG